MNQTYAYYKPTEAQSSSGYGGGMKNKTTRGLISRSYLTEGARKSAILIAVF